MASGTITGTTGNQNIISKIEWSSVPTTSTNTSKVTAALYYKRTNTGFTTRGTGAFSISIGGKTTSASKYLTITEHEWVKAIETTVTVSHDTDGGKDIKMSATGSIPDTTLSSTSCSDTVSLDTIPRASTFSITTGYTTTAGNPYVTVNGNNTMMVKINRASSSFTHKIRLYYGSTLVAEYSATISKTFPLYADNWLHRITNAKDTTKLSDANAPSVAVVTIDGSGNTIGTSAKQRFDIFVPNNSSTQPKVTSTVTLYSSLLSPFSKLPIQGKTSIGVEISAEGKYKADIVQYVSNIGTDFIVSSTLDDIESKRFLLSTSGRVTITSGAVDSRGYTSYDIKEVNVLSYSTPRVVPASGETEIICKRCTDDGTLSPSGTRLKIKASRLFSTLTSDGVQNNHCLIRYRYRVEGSNTYTAWKTILAKDNTTTDTLDTIISDTVFATDTSYVVQIGVEDDLGESDVVQISVPKDDVTIHVAEGGKRIGFLRYANTDDGTPGIDVGAPIYGGSVDSLKIGTRLTATEEAPIDLDDIKTPGCYYSPSGTNSEYILNTPYTGGGFGLEVRELQSSIYIAQTMYFGRTRWVRHWNGEEWSTWLRFLMTTESESTSDIFITDSSTSNGWTYKCYKDGSYDMFGYFTVTTTTAGTAIGSLYYSEQFALPTPFPISSAVVSGSALSWFIPISGGQASEDSTHNIGFRLFRPTAFDKGVEINVRLRVTGELY